MGLDFIRRAAPSFHKGLDRMRIELGTPRLFTHQPSRAPRSYVAKLRDGQTLKPGEKLGVRLDGQQVIATRGLDPVASIDSPPAELMTALSASHGEACGVVQEVYTGVRIVEMTVW